MTESEKCRAALIHGCLNRYFECMLAINLPVDAIRRYPDEFVLSVHSCRTSPGRQDPLRMAEAKATCSEALDERGVGLIHLRLQLRGDEQALSLGYREKPGSGSIIPILARIPLRFDTIAWRPERCSFCEGGCSAAGASLCTPDEPKIVAVCPDAKQGARQPAGRDPAAPVDLRVPSLFHAPGKWHVSHAFAQRADYPLIFLWRCETPAHFEMHSHVMSNHCAPLPAIWEKDALMLSLQPEYGIQDLLAGLELVKGEAGAIGKKPTATISDLLLAEMGGANLEQVFPFLKTGYSSLACLMPMDMEYMHFDGYFGIPVVQKSQDGRWWHCWNRMWKKETNIPYMSRNLDIVPMEGPAGSETASSMPRRNNLLRPPQSSSRGETWCYEKGKPSEEYMPWEEQLEEHATVFDASKSGSPGRALAFPYLHFDPRRHTNQGIIPSNKATLGESLELLVPSSTWDGRSFFFGVKLYTAMGWAPRDPLLRDPLEKLYAACERDQIPILNHCTPMGFYTHDRPFYFDLLTEEGLISESARREDKDWPTKFPLHVPMPDGDCLLDAERKVRPPQSREEKIWWFIQNYVSPAAWAPLVRSRPCLKLCLAHFGDSVHLDENGWEARKVREPAWTTRRLTVGFDGPRIERRDTHAFLADLLELVQPDNRVFIDLSYVLLNESNGRNLQKLFDWARRHKPILLERILWGTDWPLPGNEYMVKGNRYDKKTMLQRYAQGFRGMLAQMPSDFYLRACFLNPIQYLDLHRISRTLASRGHHGTCPWLAEIDPAIFADFSADKLVQFYRHHKDLVHALK